MNQKAHPIFWWKIKVICGFTLLMAFFDRFFIHFLSPLFTLPNIIPQVLVVVGGLAFIYHYILLKKANPIIANPVGLMTAGGLFRYIRHPMYFADIVLYTGLALFLPNWITIFVLIVSYFALYKQSKSEDLYISTLFPVEHKTWVSSANLIIPYPNKFTKRRF
jgi:protein-S-isoprenylcysteine O-methyltransferase Ste14